MRPITLKVRGLNSYTDEQAVDFETLTADGIFGIFGPTGSGKTTVIDAITLALYGRVPRHKGTEMEFVNPAGLGVYIFFKFSFDNEIYTIERTYKKKTSAEGRFVASDSAARLFGADQKAVAEGKAVTRWVEQQTGLTYENFTRVVVLPQGEFGNLLTLSGEKVGEMLQDIFRLHKYGEALKKNIDKRRDKLETLIESREKDILQYPDCTAENLAAKSGALAKAQASLEADEAAKTEADNRLAVVSNLKKCYDRQAANAGQLSAVNADIAARRAAIRAAELASETAGAAYEQAKRAKDAGLGPLTERISRIGENAGRVKALEGDLNRLLEEHKTLGAKAARAKLEKERLENDKKRLETDMEAAEKAISEAETPYPARNAAIAALNRFQTLENTQADITAKTARLNNEMLSLNALAGDKAAADAAFAAANQALDALNANYEGLKAADPNKDNKLAEFRQALHDSLTAANAAQILSGVLKPDAPCPVCGSTDHPAPARRGVTDGAIQSLQRDIEKLKSDIALYENDKKILENNIEKAAKTLEESRRAAGRLEVAFSVKSNACESLKADIQSLETHKSEILDETAESGGLKIESLEAARRQIHAIKQKDELREALIKAREIRKSELAALSAKYEGVSRTYIDSELELKGVTERGLEKRAALKLENEALAALTGGEDAGALLAGLKAEKDKLQADEETARAALDKQTNALNAGRLELNSLLGRESQLAAEKAQLAGELAGMLEKTGECPPESAENLLAGLEERSKALDASLKEGRERLGNLKADVQNIERNLKKLEEWNKELEESRHNDALLGALSKLVGSNRFARFLGLRQLDFVVKQASAQLRRMTGGKFEIEFSDSEKGNVFIIRNRFEGGAVRSPKTLSGGETFMVSICLALALSAKLQLSSRAPLEFFFLDEGFGNLDQNMRRAAMDFLKSLRSRRLSIGIITHVEELKEMVPVWLTVTPPDGASAGSRVAIER